MGSRPLFSAAINGVFVTASWKSKIIGISIFHELLKALANDLQCYQVETALANDNNRKYFLCKVEFQVNGNVVH